MGSGYERTWLPIGSVVRLDDGETLAVITGYMQGDRESGAMWDYGGLRHPQGWVGPESMIMFNRADIEVLLYVGHLDREGERYLQALSDHEKEYAEMRERFGQSSPEERSAGPEALDEPR